MKFTLIIEGIYIESTFQKFYLKKIFSIFIGVKFFLFVFIKILKKNYFVFLIFFSNSWGCCSSAAPPYEPPLLDSDWSMGRPMKREETNVKFLSCIRILFAYTNLVLMF